MLCSYLDMIKHILRCLDSAFRCLAALFGAYGCHGSLTVDHNASAFFYRQVKFIVPGLGDFGCLDALGKSTLEILLPKLRIYSYILLYCYKVAIAIQMAILMACLILFCRCWR